MPPKEQPQPSQKDTGSLRKPTEATQGQITSQIPLEKPSSIWDHPKLNAIENRKIRAKNREIKTLNQALRMHGLTPANAIGVIQLNQRISIDSSLIHQAVRVAAVDLGLCDPNDPSIMQSYEKEYLMPTKVSSLFTDLEKDIRVAAFFAEFSIDPRGAIKEYQNFPWEEAIKERAKAGEAVPVKPRFAAFAKMIMHSAMLQKSQELANVAKKLELEIPPGTLTFGPGYRSGVDYRAKLKEVRTYHAAAEIIRRTAIATLTPPQPGTTTTRPKEFRNLSDSVWYGLITGKVRELASTQALVQNSQFVDDLLTRIKPVSQFPGDPPRSPNIDLATLIKSKAASK